jgi:hypothetical protein
MEPLVQVLVHPLVFLIALQTSFFLSISPDRITQGELKVRI